MSNNAPDFSSTFDIAEDRLADADRRLREKRNAKRTKEVKAATTGAEKPADDPKANKRSQPTRKSVRPKRPSEEKGEVTFTHELVKKEVRRNLTLKVLEENETRFNQLFHRLQLAGDSRKKQDLADEALSLLFARYKKIVA